MRRGLRSGGLDELEVQLDLDDVSEQRVECSEVDPEVLAAQLPGGLETGVPRAVEEVGDAAELDVEA